MENIAEKPAAFPLYRHQDPRDHGQWHLPRSEERKRLGNGLMMWLAHTSWRIVAYKLWHCDCGEETSGDFVVEWILYKRLDLFTLIQNFGHQ